MEDCDIVYHQASSEKHMLKQFLSFISSEYTAPDIISGWNVETFDIPYIVNRFIRVFDADEYKQLSPWKLVNEKIVKDKYGERQSYEIVGVSILDYMILFKKFGGKYGPQSSYKLDSIAEVVLGKKKIAYDGSLFDLFLNDTKKYFEYNVMDVKLVVDMEERASLLNVGMSLAYLAGTPFSSMFGTVVS